MLSIQILILLFILLLGILFGILLNPFRKGYLEWHSSFCCRFMLAISKGLVLVNNLIILFIVVKLELLLSLRSRIVFLTHLIRSVKVRFLL